MRISGPLVRLVLYAVCGGGPLGVLGPGAASAQQRTAAIRVHATVRGGADTDVLGAHAVRAAPTGAGAESDTWRILSGRRSSVRIQVDGAEGVTLCAPAAAQPACRPHPAAHVELRDDGAPGDLVVRVAGPAVGGHTVRITIAFMDL